MEETDLLTQIIKEALNLGWVDWTATITGIIYVILAARNQVWCWFWGIISCTLWAYASYAYYQLYLDALLQLFYVVMGIYGIYQWRFGGTDQDELPITRMRLREHLLMGGIGITTGLLAGYFFSFTAAAATYADALTTTFAVLTTYLLVQKKLENWLYWIAIDAVYVWLYATRGAYLFAGLMVLYIVIAGMAYYKWQRLNSPA